MTYNLGIGIWKGFKDAVVNAIALGTGGAFALATQVEGQCPELTISAFGLPITLKFVIQILTNYQKHK